MTQPGAGLRPLAIHVSVQKQCKLHLRPGVVVQVWNAWFGFDSRKQCAAHNSSATAGLNGAPFKFSRMLDSLCSHFKMHSKASQVGSLRAVKEGAS